MRNIVIAIMLLLCQTALFSAPITIGETKTVHSKILNEDRNILVGLPLNYQADGDQKYPVMILLDGEKDFYNAVGSARYFESLNMSPGLLVVAIQNIDRNRDFLHKKLTDKDNPVFGQGGGADKFLDFIDQELLPFIAKNYSAGEYKILAGHSFGGMLSIYALESRPDSFDSYIAASPSLWFEKNDLIVSAEKSLAELKDKTGKNLYFSYGGFEEQIKISAQVYEKELNKIKPAKLDWKSEYMLEDNHMTTPLKTYYNGLQFIFADMASADKLMGKGLDNLTGYYQSLQKKYKCSIKIPYRLYSNLINQAITENKNADLFKVCESALQSLDVKNPYDRQRTKQIYNILSSAYNKQENFKLAALYTKKSIELIPGSSDELGTLAWFEVLTGSYDSAIKNSETAIALSPNTLWLKSNLIHGLIFTNNLAKAKTVFQENKDLKDAAGKSLKEMLEGDFEYLKARKITHPDLDKLF